MNELQVFKHGSADVVDSRAVAEMIGKTHAHLMRDIGNYVKVLSESAESNFGLSDFFIPSSYKDSTGRTLPCYLLTKKGCDMVANKMTGEKGVLFTAAYVTAFEAMREHIEKGSDKHKVVAMTDYQRAMTETRMQNIRIRKAQLLERMAEDYEGTYRQVLQAHATKELTGEFLLPLPEIGERTYTATEIAEMLGCSAHKVGQIANRYNLKTEKYGGWYNDKAKNSNKEVPTFRYFRRVVPVMQQIIEREQAG